MWRHIAIACCELWTEADYQHDHPEWIAEQLRRSANMPVVVKAFFPIQSSREIQDLLLAIHTLDIQAPPEIFEQELPKLNSASLRFLSLFIPLSSTPQNSVHSGKTFQLNAPNLKPSRCPISSFHGTRRSSTT
ncbi:hypothetical protein B0H10DRAFT_2061431 [Mycena sp. CBHHK59/15]|nr:hypothetical protein B0H10DRAFT_2061431 [Mycena sp. CBHHK59/15]